MSRPVNQPPPNTQDSRHPVADPGMVKPRGGETDSFEQNPLSQVAERLSIKAAEGMDDAARVREALRIVVAEGVSISEAARRCHVAASCLAEWREKYLGLLNDEPSIASRPLMDRGAMRKDADLVNIPRAAREMFAENWARLVQITRATPSTFRQHPLRVFLENSWLTGWLFNDGRLDRGSFAGASVALVVLVLTATFLLAGHFYRPAEPHKEKPVNLDEAIQRAATVAHRFFQARGVEEKMKFIRLNDQTRQLVESYYKTHSADPIFDAALSKAMPGTNLYVLEFEIPSLKRSHRCVVVERAGQLLLDWETSSIFQEANLERLRSAQPRQPVRLATQVTQDTYYNWGFTEKDFACYRLSYPGIESDLFAYARRDSPEEQSLSARLRPLSTDQRQITALLEVKYPPGEKPAVNQVEIVNILHEDWVAP